jgi:iron complex outermembrane recepter protein
VVVRQRVCAGAQPPHLSCSLFLVALGSACGVARAQTAAPAPPASAASAPLAAPQTITVTGTRRETTYQPEEASSLGAELPVQQLPASVNIVNEALLRDLNIKGLNSLANYIPGVTLDDNGGETGESLLIRGFSVSTVFVDGLRNRARYGVPRSLPDVLERVEVVKGPAGAEFGTAEFGGTVNLVTKKPKPMFAAELSAGFGDFGYRKVAADVTGAISADKRVQARLIAAYEEGAEWRKGRPDKTPRHVVAPSLNWDYSDRGSVLLQYERYQQDSPQDRGVIYLEGAFPGSNFAPRDWSFHQSTGSNLRTFDRFSLDWKRQLTDGLAARARLQQYGEKRHLREFRNANSEPDSGPGDLYNDDGRSWNGNRVIDIFWSDWRENYRTRNAVAELSGNVKLAGADHQWRVGAERYRFKTLPGTEFADTSNVNSSDIFDPRNDQSPNALTFGSPSVSRGGQQQDSTYVTWVGKWTPRWRTVVGVRNDRFEERFEDFVDGALDFASVSSADVTSWRLASSYDLARDISAFAGISNAFLPQGGMTRANRALDPTGGRSVEAGLKWSLMDGKALWTTTLYQIRQNNISACDTDPSLSEEDTDQCRFSVLFGSARVRGLESEIQGQLTGDVQLSAGVALMQSRITQTDATYSADPARAGQPFVGNRFANTPKVQASLAATVAWRALGLTQLKTTLGITHVGQRWGNQGNTVSLPAYTVVNLGTRYEFGAKTDVALYVGNLFDKTYYTAMQASGDVADQVGVGERRLVQVQLRQRF